MNNQITNGIIDIILTLLREKKMMGYDLDKTIKEIEKMKIQPDDIV